jgi:replicative DNA helicase
MMKETSPPVKGGKPTLIVEAALLYARHGVRVIRLHHPTPDGNCSCGDPGHRADAPKTSCGKHPSLGNGWPKQATTDPAVITRWFTERPDDNVGALLSAEAGIAAIDIDSAAGETLLAAMSGGDLPPTWEFRSGKGRRLMYRIPDGVKPRTVVIKDAAGEEAVRLMGGANSQTVMPPSLHYSGVRYEWVDGRDPAAVGLAAMPAWMAGEMGRPEKPPPASEPAAASAHLPGAEYNRRGSWDDLLAEHGFRPAGGRDGVRYFTRPGKAGGVSVTLGHAKTRDGRAALYVFSGSIPELPAGKSYDLFGAYTRLTHGGNFAAASEALETDGHGTPRAAVVGTVTATPQPALGWSDPVPLTPAFDPPPFPVDVLPDWMRKYAEAVAEEKQVPVDLPALLILGATAAGIARKVTVSPWPGWTQEPTNLFVLCALPPGERKSQTFAAVFAPVAALEADLRRREEPAVRAAESAQRVAQKRVDLLEGRVAKCDDPAARATLLAELTAAREELVAVVVPALPQLRVDDDTPEMLALELVRQGGRLLAASPEARTLENIDRYADKPNLDVFLKGHAGDDLRSGRVGRGRDQIDRPALTCAYAPQPCVVEALGQTPEMRGRGFLARWLYSLPVSAVGYRKVRGAAVPVGVRTEYETTLTLTWLIGYADPEAGRPHDLRFAPDAVTEFERFEAWKEEHLRPGGLLHGCGGWGNKLGGLCVRLCGLFHVADGVRAGDGWRTAPVSAAVVRRAVKLCREYAVPHARAAFALMGDTPAVAGAKAVLRWLAERDTPTAEFSKRDVFNGCRSRFETVDDLQPALDLLERHYLIRPKPDPAGRRGPGRPASPVFEVNPAAHNPHKAQNDRADAPAGGCANTADCAPGWERPVESAAKGDGR